MKKIDWSSILVDIIFFIVGLCLYMWADKVTNLVSILIGIVFIIYGLYMIIYYFRINNKNGIDNFKLVYGIIAMVFGGILVIKTSFLKELISFVIGIYIVLASIFKMQEAIDLKDKYPGYSKPLIVSIIGLIIGLLCTIGKFIIPDIINMIIGLMLMVYSVLDIISLVMISVNKK